MLLSLFNLGLISAFTFAAEIRITDSGSSGAETKSSKQVQRKMLKIS